MFFFLSRVELVLLSRPGLSTQCSVYSNVLAVGGGCESPPVHEQRRQPREAHVRVSKRSCETAANLKITMVRRHLPSLSRSFCSCCVSVELLVMHTLSVGSGAPRRRSLLSRLALVSFMSSRAPPSPRVTAGSNV